MFYISFGNVSPSKWCDCEIAVRQQILVPQKFSVLYFVGVIFQCKSIILIPNELRGHDLFGSVVRLLDSECHDRLCKCFHYRNITSSVFFVGFFFYFCISFIFFLDCRRCICMYIYLVYENKKEIDATMFSVYPVTLFVTRAFFFLDIQFRYAPVN